MTTTSHHVEALNATTALIQGTEPGSDPDVIAHAIDAVDKLAAALRAYRADLAEAWCSASPDDTKVYDIGTFTKTRKSDRTRWDRDDVLRWVLDSRKMQTGVDPGTGEIVREAIIETPLDKVLDVFTLPDPKVTALRERGMTDEQIDEYRHRDRGRRTVKYVPAEKAAMQ